jgi:hypothetical protein
MAGFLEMVTEVLRSRLCLTDPADKDTMTAAYERYNQAVRDLGPPGRLLEWRLAEGWRPLADALGLPVPDQPFPKVNTRAEFRVPELGQPVQLT